MSANRISAAVRQIKADIENSTLPPSTVYSGIYTSTITLPTPTRTRHTVSWTTSWTTRTIYATYVLNFFLLITVLLVLYDHSLHSFQLDLDDHGDAHGVRDRVQEARWAF